VHSIYLTWVRPNQGKKWFHCDVNNFLDEYQEQLPINQRFLALDIALRATPAIWWTVHNKNIGG